MKNKLQGVSKVLYPIRFEKISANNFEVNAVEVNGFEVSVPDLPGCQLSCTAIAQGFDDIKARITSHLMILAEYKEPIPSASSLDDLINRSPIDGNVLWMLIDIDVTPYLGKSHKINVTLPELLISQIDDRVSKSEEYTSRSGFIAQACLSKLAKTRK
ncbi:HicB family protein [Thalassotalea euphylliae]|uniref:HicB family protein n=1 Tax=Thalassotalea euphylliae TaxID=1655234 RepID=A0A3E0TRI7_9GAMM|nr:type II toxin-antitoxin system HicB family antitoxin [Thalassotalea euphylliae]REL26960.1 HicB family protein [Thalassotalea euphylliae]